MAGSSVGGDAHFSAESYSNYNVFEHRPHKTLFHLFNAVAATAVFRIWPTLLFIGGWSAMVVLVNQKTDTTLEFPNTMITVLGVLLGLTLSYRTSSAYAQYSEGRRTWATIISASRQWARIVWLHCPETLQSEPITDPVERARDAVAATIERRTMVQMALAFAVAVKHNLRGEEGIHYEDLYYLVNFIPGLNLPSAVPQYGVNISHDLPTLSAARPNVYNGSTTSSTQKLRPGQPSLRPAEDAPSFQWSNMLPSWCTPSKHRKGHSNHEAYNPSESSSSEYSGLGQNVPLEVIMFMSNWVSTMQRRKTIDVPTTNALLLYINQFNEALVSLERIISTPIPWSYNAHIWEVTWIYVLALPFQLYYSKFEWITVPATVIVTYIVMGYASIAEEIENPFNFDKNDLDLGSFCRNVISKELDAITAQEIHDPAKCVFSSYNQPLGHHEPSADRLADESIEELRARLRMRHRRFAHTRANTSTMDEVEMV